MSEVGYATLGVIPSFKNFGRELERGTSSSMTSIGRSGGDKFGAAAGKSAGHRFSGTFSKIAKAGALGALGGLALGGKILGDSIVAASDLGETMSKTAQIFGKDGTKGLEKFADKAAASLGQSKQQALDAAATFGIFGKSAGLQGGKLVKFSSGLDTLATDLASFSNTSPEDAINAIGSALRGESEPIRSYGVLLDDATLKAEALRLGLLKPVKDKSKILSAQARVTSAQAKYNKALAGAGLVASGLAKARIGEAQEKYNKAVKKGGKGSTAAVTAQARLADAQAKYNDLLSSGGKGSIEAITAQGQLGAAQSALKKATDGTIPTLTQQQKVLAAQSAIYKQTKDQQGDFARTSGGLANQQRILAARFADAKTELGKGLLPVATSLVTFLNDKGIPQLNRFSDWFTKTGIPAIKKFEGKATPFVKGVLSDTRDVLKQIAPHAQKVADAFNSLPDGVKKGLGAAAVLGVVGSKLPGGRAGGSAAATVAKFVLPKRPIPVFVVNKGGLGLGGGVKGAAGELAGLTAGTLTVGSVAVVGALAVGGGLLINKFGARDAPVGSPLSGKIDVQVPPLAPKIIKGIGDKFNPEPLKQAAFYSGLARQNLSKLPSDLERGMNGAESLKQQVFGVETSAKRTKATVVSLVDALEAARQHAVEVEQAVSPARSSKVDRQLGGGVTVVHNGNIVANSPRDYLKDANRRSRARAGGGVNIP